MTKRIITLAAAGWACVCLVASPVLAASTPLPFCGTVVPLTIMFKARSGPARRGRRWVPPAPGRIPSFTSGNPTCAVASATR